MHRAKGDRLVRASVLPVRDNEDTNGKVTVAVFLWHQNGVCRSTSSAPPAYADHMAEDG